MVLSPFIELNGQVLVMTPNDRHQLKLKIKNNPDTVPIVSTHHNIIINGDTGAIIKQELLKLFTLGKRLRSPQSTKDVYIYKIIGDQKEYVVKAYREELYASDKGFMKEVRFLLKFDGNLIRHPNIVKIYYGSTLKINDERINYYKMKYYKFISLDKYITNFNHDEKILQFIMLQLVNAVLFIQSHSIIHRDIRPANIFIDKFIDNLPIIALADFECATKNNFSSRKETDIVGAQLCAPEVLKEGYSFESDNFSIGLTLFQLITGNCNFKDSNVEQLSQQYNLSKEFTEIIFNLLKLKSERLSLDKALRQLFKLLRNNINWSDNEIAKIVHSNILFEYGVIEQDFRNFQFISEKSKYDNDFKREVLKRNGLIYKFFKEEEKTKIMTKLAFINNYNILNFAPKEIKQDIDLMNEFTELEPLSLKYVSNSIIENLPIMKIVQKNGLALQFSPIECKNNLEIVKVAVLQNAKALKFASDDIRKNFLFKTLGIVHTDEMFGKMMYYFKSNEFTKSLDIVMESMKYNSEYFKQYFLPLIRGKFSNLTELNVSSINIDLQGLKEISKLINLTKLYINNNNINSEGAKEISKLINLTELYISLNYINSEGAKEISKLNNLTKLYIHKNDIDSEGAKEISKLINLTELYISLNNINSEGAKEISKLINLTKLYISYNNIKSEGVKEITKLINLTKLYISYNNIKSEGVKEISKLINLTELDISNNNIDSEGVKEISKLINLTTLDIYDNYINSEGLTEISKLNNLTKLYIHKNDIDSEGAKEISKLINLTDLNISDNNIDSEGAKEISKLINLTKLYISLNNIKSEGVKEISKLINLTDLNISYNNIDSEGAKEIGNLINLNQLDISFNNINSEGAKEISKLINLTKLDISYNNIDSEGAKEFVKLNNLTLLNCIRIGVERENDIIKYYNEHIDHPLSLDEIF